jgi:transketolase C-terminal domain/subunit
MIDGGFGSRVADVLIKNRLAPHFAKFGVRDDIRGQVGSREFLLGQLGSLADFARAQLS